MSTLRVGDRVNFADNYPTTPGTIVRVVDPDPRATTFEVIWDDGFADSLDGYNTSDMDSNVYFDDDLEPLVSPELQTGLLAMIADGWARTHVGDCYLVEIDGTERDQGYEVDDDGEATEAIYRAEPGSYVVDTEAMWFDGPLLLHEAERVMTQRSL